jgi:hypothetical protein
MKQMDDKMLEHFCRSDPNIARLCRDDSLTGNRFWRDRYERSFGEFETGISSNWKDRYLDNIVPPGRFGYITSDVIHIVGSYVFGAIIDSVDMDKPNPEGGPVEYDEIRRIWTDKKTYDYLVPMYHESMVSQRLPTTLQNPARFGRYYDVSEMTKGAGIIPLDPSMNGKIGEFMKYPGNSIPILPRDCHGEEVFDYEGLPDLDLYWAGAHIACSTSDPNFIPPVGRFGDYKWWMYGNGFMEPSV